MDEKTKSLLAGRINEVLHYVWDPIGICGMPEARDEYDSYGDTVLRAVLDGKTKIEIAEILTLITTQRMELHPRKDRDEAVAEIILDWARFLNESN